MAMKHPRLVVFSAAFTALIAMTILSAVLGHTLPTLIPKKYTNFMAAVLFLVFGAKLLREGYAIRPGQGVSEEMREVEMEMEEKEELARKMGRRRSSISPYILESGRVDSRKTRSNTRLPAPPDSPPSSPESRSPSPSRGSSIATAFGGLQNLFSLLLSPAWVQTFIMTFLGEWGDRSQIATIAMAAGQDYWWVTGGAVSGHAICTAIAVIGGRAIAGRVSLRMGEYRSYFCYFVGTCWLTFPISDIGRWHRVCGVWYHISCRGRLQYLRGRTGAGLVPVMMEHWERRTFFHAFQRATMMWFWSLWEHGDLHFQSNNSIVRTRVYLRVSRSSGGGLPTQHLRGGLNLMPMKDLGKVFRPQQTVVRCAAV